MLASIYGLQALIFIFHRKFEHVGWMIVYILAIPIFSFLIPIYSFWRMDDFSSVLLHSRSQCIGIADTSGGQVGQYPDRAR